MLIPHYTAWQLPFLNRGCKYMKKFNFCKAYVLKFVNLCMINYFLWDN